MSTVQVISTERKLVSLSIYFNMTHTSTCSNLGSFELTMK